MESFDLDHLDVDAAESTVAQQSEEEANRVFETTGDDDDCAGGACKI